MRASALALAMTAACCGQAWAQSRASENATRAADDAFGVQIGNERTGLYSDRDARGFNPLSAGNGRLEGMYFDTRAILTRVIASTTIRVGLTAQNYPFPAPTGIVDYALRPFPDRRTFSSLLQAGPNEGYSVELDGQLPLIEGKFGVAAGVAYRADYQVPGDESDARLFGGVARWRPYKDAEIAAFFGYGSAKNDKANPLVFTAGPYVPRGVKVKYFGQQWSKNNGDNSGYGVYARTAIGSHWTFNLGAFHQNISSQGPMADLYFDVDQDGLAGRHVMTNELPQESPTDSGEARLTGVFEGARVRHTVHLAVRGRHVQRNFGGTAVAPMPLLTIGARQDLAMPAWNFGQPVQDAVRQWAGGAQYQIALRGLGALTLGGQKVDYEKTITPPAAPATVTTDDPFFTNAALTVNFSPRLIGYASFTQGLEEAPVAPENAVNAQEAPPAIHTEQYDFGVRYSFTPQLRLIVGYFNVQKPYFNLDPTRFYRELGLEHHRGFEISLAGPLTDRLNVVAGAVLQKPEVTGEGVQSGIIGAKPVSQPETTLRLNLDYRTPWIEGLSVDGALLYVSERAATTRQFAELGGAQLDADAYATLDLGMRYRFRINGRASTFRALAANVFNENAWKIFPSGAFYLSNPRNFQVSLATDF